MDFRELQYIITIADCESITQAAKKLYISQPSLSYALSTIEKNLGTKLFMRNQHPLQLTPAGEIYVSTARHILHEKDMLHNKIADLTENNRSQLRFGIPTERLGYMLPLVINRFRHRFPNADFQIKEAPSYELLDLLTKDKISFAILPYHPENLPHEFTSTLIYNETLPLIINPKLLKNTLPSTKLNLLDLQALPFIAIKKGHSIRDLVDQLFVSYSITPNTLIEVDSIITATQLAACGLGYTIVTGRAEDILGDKASTYCFTYTDNPLFWPVQAVYKPNTYLNKAEQYLITLMQETFSKVD